MEAPMLPKKNVQSAKYCSMEDLIKFSVLKDVEKAIRANYVGVIHQKMHFTADQNIGNK